MRPASSAADCSTRRRYRPRQTLRGEAVRRATLLRAFEARAECCCYLAGVLIEIT